MFHSKRKVAFEVRHFTREGKRIYILGYNADKFTEYLPSEKEQKKELAEIVIQLVETLASLDHKKYP